MSEPTILCLKEKVYDQQLVIRALEGRVTSLLSWKADAIKETQSKNEEFEAWKEESEREAERKEEEFRTWKEESREKAERREEEFIVLLVLLNMELWSEMRI